MREWIPSDVDKKERYVLHISYTKKS